MVYKVKTYLANQKDVVDEIIEVAELLSKKEIDHSEFEKIVIIYMKDYFELIVKKLDGEKVQLNGTAKRFLGKKRILLISRYMERHDIAKLDDVKDGIFTLMKNSS